MLGNRFARESSACEGRRVSGACPRCSTAEEPAPLALGAGALGEAVCGRCGGRLLEEAAVQRVIVEEHGVSRDTLREMAGHFGRPSLGCPSCGQRMHPIRVRALSLDLCTGCGAVWLDAGELTRLSEGRWEEIAGPPPVDSTAQTAAQIPAQIPAERGAGEAADRGTPSGFLTVLLEDEEIDADRLVTAFGRARFRTAQDARFAAQRGHGIVAERLPAAEAASLVAALAVEDLHARLVEPAALDLPRAVRTKELSISDSGLTLADGLGRPFMIPWPAMSAIGVGLVRLEEAETEIDPTRPVEEAHRGGAVTIQHTRRTVVVERDDVLLDLVAADPRGERWRFRATRDSLIFRPRDPRGAEPAFRDLVRHLIALAPASALLSRGAVAAGRRQTSWVRYRALRDYDQALRWTVARAVDGRRRTP